MSLDHTKSKSDARSYEFFRLPCGLEVVTIDSTQHDVSVTGASRVVVRTYADAVDVSGQTGVSVSSTTHDVTVTAASAVVTISITLTGWVIICGSSAPPGLIFFGQ